MFKAGDKVVFYGNMSKDCPYSEAIYGTVIGWSDPFADLIYQLEVDLNGMTHRFTPDGRYNRDDPAVSLFLVDEDDYE